MVQEPYDEVRVRRHPKGRGVYVYVPASVLAAAGVPESDDLMVTRYTAKATRVVLLRFRAGGPSKNQLDRGYVAKVPRKAETPPPSFPVESP